MRYRAHPSLLAVLSLLLFASFFFPFSSHAGDAARVTYRKVFKDSSPEFLEIKLAENGPCTYEIRQIDDDPSPRPFEVGRAVIEKAFALAAELNHFRDTQLDVRRRLANLGQKTFRWERDGQAFEVTFNFTTNPTAMQLMQLFEGLGRQQAHLDTLAHRVKYDRLGVNDALLHFEADLNRKVIPEPERLLATLESVANDSRVVDIARQRARAIIERIKSGSRE